ncbi:hypothetical protein CC80DRAFT_491908 [Byssothecium circinans]|uniref:Uncharacterized protein n=1 Tax=Byssothecium circinans TaxID=147558 RepID=A0A6A5TYB8_9PLEO|nr:hypothetical protein CC80DRAFT_491908 [Byssothecium circinans]
MAGAAQQFTVLMNPICIRTPLATYIQKITIPLIPKSPSKQHIIADFSTSNPPQIPSSRQARASPENTMAHSETFEMAVVSLISNILQALFQLLGIILILYYSHRPTRKILRTRKQGFAERREIPSSVHSARED